MHSHAGCQVESPESLEVFPAGCVGMELELWQECCAPATELQCGVRRMQVHCLTGHDDTVCSILTQSTDPQARRRCCGGLRFRRAWDAPPRTLASRCCP